MANNEFDVVSAAAALNQSLQETTELSQQKLQAWIDKTEANVEETLNAHQTKMADYNYQAEQKQTQLSALIVEKRRVAVEKEKENLEGHTLQQDLENLEVQCGELSQEVQNLQNMQRKEATMLGAKEKAIVELSSRNEGIIRELQKSLSFYRKFGLNFEKVANQKLRLTFTLIDPRDHAREFWFSLQVNGHDQYRVDECSPPVEALPMLLANLNASNDFSAFVIEMRKAFKAMV